IGKKDQVALAARIDEQHLLAVLEGKPVVHAVASRGAGRNRVGTNATNGIIALIQRAAGTPQRSATQPSAVTPAPPRPMAKPTMSPDAIPAWRGRYDWPSTIDTEK